MESDWYRTWAHDHAAMTAAGPEVIAQLLAVRCVLAGEWCATEIELLECTRRLVAECKVPKFSNEHSDAVGLMLRRVRSDREIALLDQTREREANLCPLCGSSGWVEVPLPGCVWNGQLCTLRDASGHDTGKVYFGSVTCRCKAGEHHAQAEALRADRNHEAPGKKSLRRPTLAEYTRLVGGADGPGMVAVYRRRQAEQVRRGEGPGELADVYARLRARYGLNQQGAA